MQVIDFIRPRTAGSWKTGAEVSNLSCLVAALLSMRGQSQQVMLDAFFGSLSEDGQWQRCVSDRGFAKARDRLAWGALERLNTFVVQRSDALGLVPRWHGLRVVAADASVLMPAVRACLTRRRAASAEHPGSTVKAPPSSTVNDVSL